MPAPGHTSGQAPQAPEVRISLWPERRLVIGQLVGVVNFREIAHTMERIWNDPRFRGDFDGIIDLYRCTTTSGPADFRALVDFLKQRCPAHGRWVALLNDPKATALALLFKTVNPGPFQLEVCSTWEAACTHLGIALPPDFTTR